MQASAGTPGQGDSPGAPPAFGGEGSSIGSTSGATLYGILPDDAAGGPMLADEDSGPLPSIRLAQGAASGGASSDRIGIPRDDDDMLSSDGFMSNVDVPGIGGDSYNELDLPLPGGDLELDLPDVARGRQPAPAFAPPRPSGVPTP
ncbi:MAG: hypothetical protein IAG13_22800, partial [Deltaproteobacteria bacterium]|nr:hypothetical protein [Nannocystaceae bacterium]